MSWPRAPRASRFRAMSSVAMAKINAGHCWPRSSASSQVSCRRSLRSKMSAGCLCGPCGRPSSVNSRTSAIRPHMPSSIAQPTACRKAANGSSCSHLASRIGDIGIPCPKAGPVPTVREAIGHLPGIAAGTANDDDHLQSARALTPPNLARIQASRPGGTWKEWVPTMRARCHRAKTGKTYPSVYGRMEWDKPSPTITTQFYGFGNGRFGHPDQDRALTLREGALLQTFPPEFEFAPATDRTNFRQIGKLIGNAVPVNLGVHIGAEIARHIASVHGGARKKRRSVTKRSTAVKMAST